MSNVSFLETRRIKRIIITIPKNRRSDFGKALRRRVAWRVMIIIIIAIILSFSIRTHTMYKK